MKKRATIHLSENPDDPEVDHGRWFASLAPWLLYHLPAYRQRRLPGPHRLPPPLPLLARPGLPRQPRTLPRGLLPRLSPQGRPCLQETRPAPAPRPVQGHRLCFHCPALLRLALHGRLDRRRREAPVPAPLRRPLLGPGPRLR